MAGLIMKYFVIKPSAHGEHGEASRAALEAYENVLRKYGAVEFAEDLRLWRARCEADEQQHKWDSANVRSTFGG